MPFRVGIELSPLACRIVELEEGRMPSRDASETRVRAFARLPRMGAETRAKLASLRRRQAAVVAWGLRGDHRQVVVTQGSRTRMRREALAAARAAGVETRGMATDIWPVSATGAGTRRRQVVVALAGTHELTSTLQPLLDAGIRVRSIVTPALALMSLARVRREFAVPEMAEAYVALEETATAVALIRDGVLLAAREFSWGYQNERGETRPRQAIAARLAEEVDTFLGTSGLGRGAVSQICVCGGLAELRSMTVPLMEALDLEVETLDSLFAIDATRLPSPVDEFRDRIAELRLAWAVGADWQAPINLFRERRRRQTKTMLARAAVAAGLVAAAGAGWRIRQSAWWRTSSLQPVARMTPPPARTPTPPPTRPSLTRPPAPAPKPAAPPVAQLPPPATPIAPGVVAPPTAKSVAPSVAVPPSAAKPVVPSVVVPPPPKSVAPSAAVPPPAKPLEPSVVAPAPARPVAPRVVAPTLVRPALPNVLVPPAAKPSPTVSEPARPAPPPQEVLPQPRRPVAPAPLPVPNNVEPPAASKVQPPVLSRVEAAPLPFDAVLGTILYAPERKLAIVDGRIVQVGDDVRGARVVDITPTSVLLRDAQGRLRQLTTGTSVR